MKPDLYLASISDVHLGHPKTPTHHITSNLARAFPDGPSTHALDIIVIGGDLFDRLLSADQPEVLQILEWAAKMVAMCEREKIHLVMMEGTPSHDRSQSKMFNVFRTMGIAKKYFHYITELSVVRFDDIGADILFVPDEWRPEPDDTWKEVVTLLQEQNLTQVDFTILHGTFDFQLPEHIKTARHTLSRYEEITRHYIFGAHIHIPSVRGKLRVNGSFDRLCHNEEHDKGHWRVKFNPSGKTEERFIVNENAMIYQTIDCSGMEAEEALVRVRDVAKATKSGSHLRIKANSGEAVLSNLDVLRKEFPELHWTTKGVELEQVQKNLLVDMRGVYESIQITPSNIVELVLNKMKDQGIDDVDAHRSVGYLTEFV